MVERTAIFNEIDEERLVQDALWGEQNHALPFWHCILSEEVGETARSILAGNVQGVRHELVQVAAIAVAMIEYIDRNGL